jgi:hypothetical protein
MSGNFELRPWRGTPPRRRQRDSRYGRQLISVRQEHMLFTAARSHEALGE